MSLIWSDVCTIDVWAPHHVIRGVIFAISSLTLSRTHTSHSSAKYKTNKKQISFENGI